MERFVIIINDLQPLIIITKRSILDLADVLDPPLPHIFIFISWYQEMIDLSVWFISNQAIANSELWSNFSNADFKFESQRHMKLCQPQSYKHQFHIMLKPIYEIRFTEIAIYETCV